MADARRALLGALAAAVFCATAGCVPRSHAPANGDATMDMICATSLQQLDMLLEVRGADGTTAPGVIAEVRALRAAAADLYFEGNHELALELIDEALHLLGNRK